MKGSESSVRYRRRMDALRQAMRSCEVDAYIITGTDAHCSEYPPAHWKTREWISGFTGSAGTVVITDGECALWTDSRYWRQAERQLKGTGIHLYRDGLPHVDGVPNVNGVPPKLTDWLVLPPGSRVGVDGRTVSARQFQGWQRALALADVEILGEMDLIQGLWEDRPALSVVDYWEVAVAGESRVEKLQRLRAELAGRGADVWIGMNLESVAWMLNLRASATDYVHVGNAYLVVGADEACWYTHLPSVSGGLRSSLEQEGFGLKDYGEFWDNLGKIPRSSTVLQDLEHTSYAIASRLDCGILGGADPVIRMKSRKNAVEAERFAQAMVKDGAALVRFIVHLEKELRAGRRISEVEACRMLREHRRAFPGYVSDSFATIAAFEGNGAMCHHAPQEDVFISMEPGGESRGQVESRGNRIFLIDSGAHWQEGTTDVTRTLVFGEPNEQQKTDYTLVLKGHLALSRARWPIGTCGYQLDTLARSFLWQHGQNYGHGTGHGVGYLLGVHEGPQNIGPKAIEVSILPGMIVSNEPGLYREDEYGIRIENLLLCESDADFQGFCRFKTLTLAPYCREFIHTDLLTKDEKDWINQYHRQVRDALLGNLNNEEEKWLMAQTEEIQV